MKYHYLKRKAEEEGFPMPRIARVIAVLLGLFGCDRITAPSITYSTFIEGSVYDVDEKPLADVTLTVEEMNVSVKTDAAGNFLLKFPLESEREMSISARTVGYGRAIRRVATKPNSRHSLFFSLRPSTMVNFALVKDGAAHVLEMAGGDGSEYGMSLAVPPASLRNRAGEIVEGDITAEMTYYYPGGGAAAFPVDMVAVDSNGVYDIQTYGMLDVVLRARGEELQVNEGSSLTLSNRMPAEVCNSFDTGELPKPELYSFDEATGRWRTEIGLSRSSQACSSTGPVTHLSIWNVDGCTPLLGSCVRGLVVDEDGEPAAGVSVLIQTNRLEQGGESETETITGANGMYCANLARYGISNMMQKFRFPGQKAVVRYLQDIKLGLCGRCDGKCQAGIQGRGHWDGQRGDIFSTKYDICEGISRGEYTIPRYKDSGPTSCGTCAQIGLMTLPYSTQQCTKEPMEPCGADDVCCKRNGAKHKCSDGYCFPE